MKNSNYHIWSLALLVVVAQLPLPNYAYAEDDEDDEDELSVKIDRELNLINSVEVGMVYNDNATAESGKFTDRDTDGIEGVVNIDILGRDASEKSAAYYRIQGNKLGTGIGDLSLEYGDQGNYSIEFDYDQKRTNYFGDIFLTPWQGSDTNLLLPDGWDPETSPTEVSNYSVSNLGVSRKTSSLNYKRILNSNWTMEIGYSHLDKEGNHLFGVGQGYYGTAQGKEPIDTDLDEITTTLTYSIDDFQLAMEYFYSSFENSNESLTFENPLYIPSNHISEHRVDNHTSDDIHTFIETGQQQMALAPDNQLQRFSVTAGYNFSPVTRVTANLSYAEAKQDEDLLPYVYNSDYYNVPTEFLSPSVDFTNPNDPNAPLPRSSFDGKYDTTLAQIQFITRPTRKLNLKAKYRYEEKNNKSSTDLYNFFYYTDTSDKPIIVVVNDDGPDVHLPNLDRNGSSSENYLWANQVPEKEVQTVNLEAAYRFGNGVKLRAGYDYEDYQRTTEKLAAPENVTLPEGQILPNDHVDIGSNGLDSFTNKTTEDTVWGEVKWQIVSGLRVKLKAISSNLDTDLDDEYVNFWVEDGAALSTYLLERDQDIVKGSISYVISPEMILSVTGSREENDYDGDDVPFGMQWSKTDSWNVNLSHMISDTLTLNSFGGYLRSVYEYDSKDSTTGLWSSNTNQNTHFAGFGLNWEAVEDVIDVRLDYSYSDSKMENVQTNLSSPSLQLPVNSVRRNEIKLGVDWHYSRQTTFALDYQFSNMRTKNWGWDPTAYLGYGKDTITGNPNALVTNEVGVGYEEPDYDAHYLMMSVKYNFK